MKTLELLKAYGFAPINMEYPSGYYYLALPNSDAAFHYYEKENKLSLMSSDSGDTSTVVEFVGSIERMKELYLAISNKELKLQLTDKLATS